MKTLPINGEIYHLRGLSVFDQLIIARKLSVSSVLVGSLSRSDPEDLKTSLLMIGILSRLTDEDSQSVTALCLKEVTREQDGQRVKILSSGGLMFQDITLQVMLQLIIAVLVENLGDFFLAALADLAGPLQTKEESL